MPPQCYVYIYAGLGERERALAYQEKAYEDGASPFNYLFARHPQPLCTFPASQAPTRTDAPRGLKH